MKPRSTIAIGLAAIVCASAASDADVKAPPENLVLEVTARVGQVTLSQDIPLRDSGKIHASTMTHSQFATDRLDVSGTADEVHGNTVQVNLTLNWEHSRPDPTVQVLPPGSNGRSVPGIVSRSMKVQTQVVLKINDASETVGGLRAKSPADGIEHTVPGTDVRVSVRRVAFT